MRAGLVVVDYPLKSKTEGKKGHHRLIKAVGNS